jgi:hypothetical protein
MIEQISCQFKRSGISLGQQLFCLRKSEIVGKFPGAAADSERSRVVGNATPFMGELARLPDPVIRHHLPQDGGTVSTLLYRVMQQFEKK